MKSKKFRILSAITAGSLTLAVAAAITVGSSSGHAAQPAALAAQTQSFPSVNLDDCPILHTGYHGGCVAQLQTDLNSISGNHLAVDGTFGPQTYAAVIAFQGANGLPQDGMVGPATKKALEAAVSVPTPTLLPPTASASPQPAAGSGSPVPTPTATTGAVPVSSSSGASLCKGAGGVLNNVVGAATGSLQPAILGEPDLGTPYLDGDVVRVDSSVPFYSWGSCADQVAFQMQTKVCGFFGCNWVTRNNGIPEFFWAHDDTGVVSQQVTMACRAGTNSYRVQMQVIGLSSSGDVDSQTGEAEAIGVEQENDTETGPVIKLTC